MPKLCLFALKDIHPGDELLYDYGDIRKNLWWRKKVRTYSDLKHVQLL